MGKLSSVYPFLLYLYCLLLLQVPYILFRGDIADKRIKKLPVLVESNTKMDKKFRPYKGLKT